MELRLYKTLDNENVINKNLSLIHTMKIKLKDKVSIINPTLILSVVNGVDYFQCNYCYLSEFKRYYFIRDIELMSDKNYRMQLEVDVLESFKDDILNSKVLVTRQKNFNPYYDYKPRYEVRKEVDLFFSNTALSDGKTILLTTIGGV